MGARFTLRRDADTVGSITGQMAGAIHGEIPQRWLDGLRHREQIAERARALFRHEPYDAATMDLVY